MAEAIILPLATSILKKIASFTGDLMVENVTAELKGFKSVKKDLKAIAEDLESITAVLQDAEAKQYSNAAMKIWLRDLKSVVYDIDDLLDEVATDALQKSLKGHLLPKLGYYLSFKPLTSRIDLSHKIKDLRLQLQSIVVKKNNFGLTKRPIEVQSVQRNVLDACGYVNKFDIVGRDEAKNSIINTIMSLGNKSGVSVFPIYGMGGIGKTALAKLVYGDINRFDIKLWVCVSDKFDLTKILQSILTEANYKSTSKYSLGQLVEMLQDELKGKRYFLVLDDLWEDDMRLWKELKSILGVGRRGSVILITTRLKKVASMFQTVEPFNLDRLSNSVCWSIFKRSVFTDGEEKRYPNLKKIGMSILEKCCGIPLVVQCLGSFLQNERDEREWVRINNMDNLNQLNRQYDTVKQLLRLSYDKLPSHLKPLFAHLSLNAKDFVYSPVEYIYYFSALGLCQLRDGSYSDNNSFNELVSRSMLQDVGRYLNNEICSFKIHDLLHDLAEDILGEELVVVTMNNLSVPESSRYIAWGLDDLTDKEFPIKAKKARAFIFRYEMRSVVSQSFLKGIISDMPCLRILVFAGNQFEELPSSIGNLKHLRLLRLSYNTLIKSVPNTICELLNLECLDLEGCEQLEKLPSEIYKLINLRYLSITTKQSSFSGIKFNKLPCLQHLCFNECMELVSLWDSYDIGSLTSLRTLEICECPKLTYLPSSMKQLVSLEELQIGSCKILDLGIGDAFTGLRGLRSLEISEVPRLTYLPYDMGSAAASLKYLFIEDCDGLFALPSWLRSSASLEELVIKNCTYLSRSCAAPDGKDLSLIRHVPNIWLDGCRIALNEH